jgi:Cu+-exporting ATPase
MSTSPRKMAVTALQPAPSAPAQVARGEDEHEHKGIEKSDLTRIGLVGLTVIFCLLRIWELFPKLDIIGLAAVLIGGYPIDRQALTDVFSRRMTMELSMTIALASALVIREVFTALVIVFFVLIAEVLEELTVGRGRQAMRDLLAFLPATAE